MADNVYDIERWNKSSTLNRVALVSTTLEQAISPWGCFHITNTAKNRITTTTKSMSHHANRDQNYNNIYSHMYILKPQSQQNHNQEKERLCCSSWTLLRQLVENLCPTGNSMTMNIIVKAHTPKKIENYLFWQTIENRKCLTRVFWTNRPLFCNSTTNLSHLFR